MINAPNKDRTAVVIHEHFDPIPDMSGSIDSSIFVMCHATFDAIDFLNHLCPTLDRRHLACIRTGVWWYREPHIADLSGSQRALHDSSPEIFLPRNLCDVAAAPQ